jgi:polysaccharide biosynthesis/export protein
LFRELQETSLRLSQIRERLQSVGEKIQYTAMVRSQLARGTDSRPDITIIRKGKNGPEQIVANEDTELQPGDTVEVSLRYQDMPDLPSRKGSSSSAPTATGRTDVTAAGSPPVDSR